MHRIAFLAFDGFNLVWEHNGGLQSGPYGRNYGIAFTGNDATLVVDRRGWELLPEARDGAPSNLSRTRK